MGVVHKRHCVTRLVFWIRPARSKCGDVKSGRVELRTLSLSLSRSLSLSHPLFPIWLRVRLKGFFTTGSFLVLSMVAMRRYRKRKRGDIQHIRVCKCTLSWRRRNKLDVRFIFFLSTYDRLSLNFLCVWHYSNLFLSCHHFISASLRWGYYQELCCSVCMCMYSEACKSRRGGTEFSMSGGEKRVPPRLPKKM